MDLDQFLIEALQHQARTQPKRKRSKKHHQKISEDYTRRLSDRALYRRLMNETNIAQDGIRFIFYFGHISHSEGQSLDWWRKKIDKEIVESHRRREASNQASETVKG